MSLSEAQRGLLENCVAYGLCPSPSATSLPKDPQQDAAKNLSRALSALAVSALCDVASKEAAEAVVDDYDDFGIDAIYYMRRVKLSISFKGSLRLALCSARGSNAFVQGIRKLMRKTLLASIITC